MIQPKMVPWRDIARRKKSPSDKYTEGAVTILKLAEQVATDKAVIAARFVDVNIPALGL
jgi:hypothetical protein